MKNKGILPGKWIILALVSVFIAFISVAYQIFSLDSLEKSIGFSTQGHDTNRTEKMRTFSEPKSKLDNSRTSGPPALSAGDFVDFPNNENKEKFIEAPAGRLDFDKNARKGLSNKVSGLMPLPDNSFHRNSLPPALPSSQTSAISHDIVYVPVGVSVPAILAQPSAKSALDAVSQEEVQTMAETFLSNMDEQIHAGTPKDSAWEKLQQISDDAFRARYGWEAFNTESARANEQATALH